MIAALLLVGAALPAAAESVGAPVPLLPRRHAAAPAVKPAAPRVPVRAGGTIEQQPLAPADASWSGTLGPSQGGFAGTMWQGTERSFVAAALPLLQPSTSPTLQGLARRLLLSNATPPEGRDPPQGPSLAALRLDRLLALGDVSQAVAVMGGLPPDSTGDGMDRTRAELAFASGDTAGACRAVHDGIARYQNVWWQRAVIVCQVLNDDSAGAALGLSLLREQKARPDPAFDALVERRRIEKLPDPSPMLLALLAAEKQPLPQEALQHADPAALLAYATSDKVPLERRLAAAERAAALGALPLDALVADYRAVPASDEARSAALKSDKPPEDAKARAILFQVARSNAPAASREAAIARLLADARKRALFPFAARLVAPAIEELTPGDAQPDFAADAARVLLVSGEYEKAQPWIAAAGEKALLLLSRLGSPQTDPAKGEDEAVSLRDAIASLAGRNSAAAPAQDDLLLALAASFDQPLGSLDWTQLMTPPHQASLPNAALWLDQQRAAADKRIGETVLTTLLLARSGERLTTEPVLLSRAIAGLRAVGLDSDARALALEAAVDAGI